MPESVNTMALPPQLAPSALLGAKLAALRRKQVAVAALTGVSIAVATGVELLALALFVDWWIELAWGARFVLLAAQWALLAYVLIRYAVAPLIRQPDDDELALMVEKARPEFRSRLIAAIQLTRPGALPPGASAALVDAMIEETEAMAAPLDFNRLVATDKLKKLGLVALLVSFMGIMALVFGGATPLDLLRRALLANIPLPRKTLVFVPEGNQVVGIGDNARLEAWVQGIIPATGKVEVDYRGRRAQEFTLEQARDNLSHFGRTIENVQDSFSYRIYLNDGVSLKYEVRAIPRPAVAALQCDQEFPAYTKLKAARRSPGDLSLLAGSRLSLRAMATKEIKTAAIRLIGLDQELPMQVNTNNLRELTGGFTVPAKGMNGFSLQMLDREGMASKDSAVYRVDILPDKAPVVRLTYPDRQEELITRRATMIVGFEVVDDFAIARVRLRYKVSTVEDGSEQSAELDLEGQQPQRLRRRHEWKIGAFAPPLAEGSVIEYWIEALDNNDATGPGVGASEHQFARVVSEAEKRADLLNRAGDSIGSITDVANDQEQLNRNLGAIIREKTQFQ